MLRRLLRWPPSALPATQLQQKRGARRSVVAARLAREAAGRGVPWPGQSEWWTVDGEMHEIGEGVPHRERFAIPRDNIPNRRRKHMREQFMRRTRLFLKDSQHEAWCKNYMELYQELRENWERLYWDEGYSKKIAEDHANRDSSEDDEMDFSPFRRRRSVDHQSQDQGFPGSKQDHTWDRVSQIRDKFEYDRQRNMQRRAFAPMNRVSDFVQRGQNPRQQQPIDVDRFFPQSHQRQDG